VTIEETIRIGIGLRAEADSQLLSCSEIGLPSEMVGHTNLCSVG